MTNVDIRIRIKDVEDLEAAQDLAFEQTEFQLETVSSSKAAGDVKAQMEPVTAVLIGAGAALVAKFVMDWWDKRRGGLVVDMRTDAKDDIYRDSDVPYGFILTFPADGGKVTIDTKDAPKDAIHQLLETVISGAYSTASELAKAAKVALPDSSVEEKSETETADSQEE